MSHWTAETRQLGELTCRYITHGQDSEVAVILCHGYGAPGEDLVGLAEPLIDALGAVASRFRFVFPAAPLQPPELAVYGGRAWWAINMAALLAASESASFSQLHDKVPPGLDRAGELLTGVVQAVRAELPADGRYALGGFSQGAMLTLHTALTSALPPPQLLVQFSGTLICQSQWQAALDQGRLRQTDVWQSHGRQDAILPLASARLLGELLAGGSQRHQLLEFDGPHTIPGQAIDGLAKRLKLLVD